MQTTIYRIEELSEPLRGARWRKLFQTDDYNEAREVYKKALTMTRNGLRLRAITYETRILEHSPADCKFKGKII